MPRERREVDIDDAQHREHVYTPALSSTPKSIHHLCPAQRRPHTLSSASNTLAPTPHSTSSPPRTNTQILKEMTKESTHRIQIREGLVVFTQDRKDEDIWGWALAGCGGWLNEGKRGRNAYSYLSAMKQLEDERNTSVGKYRKEKNSGGARGETHRKEGSRRRQKESSASTAQIQLD
ncbi:hypothetical protein B0H12DRAFT_1073678 [Mycena haematopus]|nr:hypothetical protein B0H12DRAFT_1073678 [Mycena haematopus]